MGNGRSSAVIVYGWQVGKTHGNNNIVSNILATQGCQVLY